MIRLLHSAHDVVAEISLFGVERRMCVCIKSIKTLRARGTIDFLAFKRTKEKAHRKPQTF